MLIILVGQCQVWLLLQHYCGFDSMNKTSLYTVALTYQYWDFSTVSCSDDNGEINL